MAKIANYVQKPFAGGIPPTDTLSIFGALKAGYTPSNSYSSNIETLQSLAAWDEGLNSAMINYYNPALQDMNTLFHVPSREISYCQQAGIPEWKANITYEMGSIVSDGLGSIYKSIVDTNLNQPFTSATKWLMVDSIKVTEVGTADYTALNTDYIIRWSLGNTGVLTPRKITIPDAIPSLMGRKYIIKSVSGAAYEVLVYTVSNQIFNTQAARGHLVLGKTTQIVKGFSVIICDGSAWWELNFDPGV